MANAFQTGLKQTANSATVPKNSINEPSKSNHLTHNTFNISYDFYNTERFGDVTPFYVAEGVSGDKNPLSSTHVLKSFATESPLMTGISKKKGYFAVPYKAILPENYDKVFVQPKKGDDISLYGNTVFSLTNLSNLLSVVKNSFDADVIATGGLRSLTVYSKFVFLLEMFFSHGSLLNILGYKLSNSFRIDPYNVGIYAELNNVSFDYWFDNYFVDMFIKHPVMINIPSLNDSVLDGVANFRNYYRDNDNPTQIPFGAFVSTRRLIELMRDYPDFQIVAMPGEATTSDSTLSENFLNHISEGVNILLQSYLSFMPNQNLKPLNFARLAAYQIAHRVFFSNDDVDDIYTANLYRQNLTSLYEFGMKSFDSSSFEWPYFVYNGVSTRYDVLSGSVVGSVFTYLAFVFRDFFNGDVAEFDYSLYAFLHEIFSIQKSLRFGDYFLGGRISPLAVGDVNAPVVSSNVSALDMTKSIQMQRFLNFVNKIPSQVSSYLRDMFGVNPAPDLTEPSYLAVTKSDVSGFEVENTTSDDQGRIVLNLVSNESQFAFEVDVDDPVIIVGVSWYEMPRVYTGTIERPMLHQTRNDMFQPMLQYLGDQSIYGTEFNTMLSLSPFAYTLRNMEYKQRFHQASGGFVESLKSWSNVIDNDDTENSELVIKNINPYLIRARNYEFDRFFGSISGYSLGTYYHFIVKYTNNNHVTRPMAVSPQILG